MTTEDDVIPPYIIVPEGILDAIIAETKLYPAVETGQAIIGLITDTHIIVMGVVPDMNNTHRERALLKVGGSTQRQLYEWYKAHWEWLRANVADAPQAEWYPGMVIQHGTIPVGLNTNLSYLGEWHKHPGSYNQISRTDLIQVSALFNDAQLNRVHLLFPIVVMMQRPKKRTRFENKEHVIELVSEEVRINWYYAHRDTYKVPLVQPIIVPNNEVPWLPPIPWHIKNMSLMKTELSLLKKAGYSVSWKIAKIKSDEVFKICFTVDHEDWDERMLIVTSWDYPHSKPIIRTLPKTTDTRHVNEPTPNTPKQSLTSRLFGWLFGNQPKEDTVQETVEPVYRQQQYLLDIVLARHDSLIKETEPNVEPYPEPTGEHTSQEVQ